MPGYRLSRELAPHGATARYAAVREGADEREVTVTIFPIASPAREDSLAKVAGLLRTLDSPVVEKVLDHGRLPSGAPFFVTPRLSGRSLAERLANAATLEPGAVAALARRACAGLAAVHRVGFVHGTLSTVSLFLSGGDLEALELVGFGMRSGDVHAGPSPEQCAGLAVGPRCDLYALGAVMFEALCGEPRPAVTAELQPPASLVTRGDGAAVPDALAQIVRRCLATDPAQRFESADALAAALAPIAPDSDAGPSTPRVPLAAFSPTHSLGSGGPDGPPPLQSGPPPGTVLGSYRLVQLLGEGGMGLVYLAEHVRLGRRVALKLLRAELGGDAQSVSRFFAEARAVNQICHENIVEITDFLENPDGDNYYIMEFLPGLNLEQVVQRDGTLQISRALGIAVQVCSALASVHDAGIVHRDLKPENIFLTERGGQKDFVKLLDFGIAKLGKQDGAISTHKTGVGIIIGTPEYMSPEQASGLAVDPRSDIYSLGIILYELLAQRNPFGGENFGEMLVNRLSKTPTPPSQDAKQPVPGELDELILQCIATARESRPQTIREVETRLRAIAEAHACELERFEERPPPRSRRPQLAVAAAVLMLVGVVALFIQRSVGHRVSAPRPPVATPGVASPVAPVAEPVEKSPQRPATGDTPPSTHEEPAEPSAPEAHAVGKDIRKPGKRRTQKLDGPSRRAVIDPFK